jgi:hypothetical protein
LPFDLPRSTARGSCIGDPVVDHPLRKHRKLNRATVSNRVIASGVLNLQVKAVGFDYDYTLVQHV